MGSIRKPTYTRALPEGAEVFTRKGKRFVRWTDSRGKKHVAELTKAGDAVLIESQTFVAKYRDGAGQVVTKSTGCKAECVPWPGRGAVHDMQGVSCVGKIEGRIRIAWSP